MNFGILRSSLHGLEIWDGKNSKLQDKLQPVCRHLSLQDSSAGQVKPEVNLPKESEYEYEWNQKCFQLPDSRKRKRKRKRKGRASEKVNKFYYMIYLHF